MMSFNKFVFTLLAAVAVFLPRAQAQFKRTLPYNYWRLAVGAGASNYFGDLDDWRTYKFTKPGIAFSAAYRVTPLISIRGSLYYGQIGADDAKSVDPIRNRRNLNFRSNIVETSVVGVVDFRMSNRRAKFRPNFTPFAFAGIAYFNASNPQIKTQSGWQEIPLGGLTGQGTKVEAGDNVRPPSARPFAIPMGVGLRFKVTPNIDVEVETGFRKTFTDYLDGVSNEYDPTQWDNPLADLPRNLNQVVNFNQPNRDIFMSEVLAKEGVYQPEYTWNGTTWTPTGRIININENMDKGSRGHSAQKDWYTFTAVTVSLYLPNGRRCPTFR